MVTETEFSESRNTKALLMVTKNEKLLAVCLNLILISCLNDKFVRQK